MPWILVNAKSGHAPSRIGVGRRENELPAELDHQNSSISHCLAGCGKPHSSSCESGCKNTTYSFQSARTGADHRKVNTILIRLRNILLSSAYIAGLATSTVGGSYPERENTCNGPPLQTSASKTQTSTSAVPLLQNWIDFLMHWSATCGVSVTLCFRGRSDPQVVHIPPSCST